MYLLYKDYKIELQDGKYSLRDISAILNRYNEDDLYLSLEEVKDRFKEEKDLIKYLSLYTKKLGIVDFIKVNNYPVAVGPWFKDVFSSLFENKKILLSSDILKLLRYGFSNNNHPLDRSFKKGLKKTLTRYKIPFEEIKYHPRIKYKAVHDEYKLTSVQNANRRKWILLSSRNFKYLITQSTRKSIKEFRRYYISLKRVLLFYKKYLLEFNRNLERKKTFGRFEKRVFTLLDDYLKKNDLYQKLFL